MIYNMGYVGMHVAGGVLYVYIYVDTLKYRVQYESTSAYI